MTPEAWLAHFHRAVAAGDRPDPPQSRDELLLADREGLLEIYPQWIPGKQGLRMLNLPPFFGRRLPPYGLRVRERCIETMAADPVLVAAVRKFLMGG